MSKLKFLFILILFNISSSLLAFNAHTLPNKPSLKNLKMIVVSNCGHTYLIITKINGVNTAVSNASPRALQILVAHKREIFFRQSMIDNKKRVVNYMVYPKGSIQCQLNGKNI